ncbi:2-dehydro-3-deoxygalactonokinase [Puniceibacterium confluentis]|uniref:2-dehydro-3-deoxygalactonokinase n=2 Tax=Puniceibacterium confluentis TaxID=1958944 RepID=UPI003F6DDB3F
MTWIAADWGTSHLRVWLMGAGGEVIARRDSGDGMGKLEPDGFEPALLALIGEALPEGQSTPVMICGMAGSRQGWAEAPYATVPCKPPSAGQTRLVGTSDPRLRVRILPGVKQEHPADVMRGEETQIAGFLALNPGYDGIICLPGTHCKWAHVSAGEIVSFRTFMTGELFALLSRQSVLRHSVPASGWDEGAFADAVDRVMSRPESLAASLFGLRAEALLHDLDGTAARSRLSGLLIGAELAAAKPYWLGQQVALLGDTAIAAPYRAALMAQSVPVTLADAERMTLEGLKAAQAKEETT